MYVTIQTINHLCVYALIYILYHHGDRLYYHGDKPMVVTIGHSFYHINLFQCNPPVHSAIKFHYDFKTDIMT